MTKRNTQSGFTLIELLVVIAIIGILSATVIASLNDARQSARQSAIIQQVDSMAKLLELNAIQTPGPGYVDANRVTWISSTAGANDCNNTSLAGLTAENQTKFREICNSIAAQSDYEGTSFLRAEWENNDATYGNYYSIMARASSNWSVVVCAGSSGGRYVGNLNPGTGNYTGAGCRLNP